MCSHLKVGILPARTLHIEPPPPLLCLVLVHGQQDVAQAAALALQVQTNVTTHAT